MYKICNSKFIKEAKKFEVLAYEVDDKDIVYKCQ